MFILSLVLFLLSPDLKLATSALINPPLPSDNTHPNTHSTTTTTTHSVFSNYSIVTTTTTITTVVTVTTIPIPHGIPFQLTSSFQNSPVLNSLISSASTLNPIGTSEPSSIDIPISENLVESAPTSTVITNEDIKTKTITTTGSPEAAIMPSLENLLIYPTSSFISFTSDSTPSSSSSIISPHATSTSLSSSIISTTHLPEFDPTSESDLLSTTPFSPSTDDSFAASFSSTDATTNVPESILSPEYLSIDPTPQSDLLTPIPPSSSSDDFLAASFSSTFSSITSTTDVLDSDPTSETPSGLLSTTTPSSPSDNALTASIFSTSLPADDTTRNSNDTILENNTTASPPNTITSASTLPATSTEAPSTFTTSTKAPRPRGCETVDPSWSGAFERCEDVSNHVIFYYEILEKNVFGSAPTLEVDFENILSMCAAYERCPSTNYRQCYLPFLSKEKRLICRAANILKSEYGVCLRKMNRPLPQDDQTAEAKKMCNTLSIIDSEYDREIMKNCGVGAADSFDRQRGDLKVLYECNPAFQS